MGAIKMSCRKKIDSKIWNEWAEYTQVMESEVRNLRQELGRTQEKLRLATRRCRQLVRELDGLSSTQERQRCLRDQQLARILRALLVLESRLKHEQKSIRQLLCDKDSLIRTQQLEIARLRRCTKGFVDSQTEQGCCAHIEEKKACGDDVASLEPTDFRERDSGLSKDIQKLKCEIMTKLSEGLEERTTQEHPSSNIRKTHSFAGSDISKASLTSSENTDASIITTTTDGSPSLLSTEGFCEGESTDVSPGSTLNKSSNRCTPTIVTTDSETEVTMVILDDRQQKTVPIPGQTNLPRSESKDDGMDCNYVSDEDEDEPIYENNVRNMQPRPKNNAAATKEDCSNNNVQVTITRIDAEEQNQDESSGNWYSDPDEDRLNDELLRHSVYRPNSNHNSVLECVNQILLRDMEDEENILSVPRRFKHRGKIVRFQPARLSDIESVGSEMERRNSEEPTTVHATPATITTDETSDKEQDENDNEGAPSIDGFEATNSEDEFGMRIVPPLDPESGLEEDVDETKARPIVIIEPCVKIEEPLDNNSSITRSLTNKASNQSTSPTSLCIDRLEDKTCLRMSSKGLTIAKNLDYEDIESLPEIISTPPKVPPALPPKPQFHNNTLILKKIPSPSFLIDETSRKKQLQQQQNGATRNSDPGILGIGGGGKPPLGSSARSLKFDNAPKKNGEVGGNNDNNESTSFWKNRFNNVRSSFQLRQGTPGDASRTSPETDCRTQLPKVTNIVKQFEEFKIEGGNESNESTPKKSVPATIAELELDDIRQNFEEFNLDECDLSDDPDRPEADGSETLAAQLANAAPGLENNLENNNIPTTTTTTTTQQMQQQPNNGNLGGNYDSFLEATGLSNKSILTPSRLLSNHKSMLKPKDVKYKSKIKATAVLERHGIAGVLPGLAMVTTTTTTGATSGTTHTKHWTGPFV